MQESPNFNNYLNRFRNVDRTTVLDSREVISGADRRFLESVYERFDLYFSDEDFRSQISLSTRTTIEDNYINNILSYLETIMSWQRDGATQVNGPNLQSQIQNINSQLLALDQQIAGYYFTYLSSIEPLGKRVQTIQSLTSAAEQEAQGLHDIVENVKDQVNSRKETFDATVNEIENNASAALNSQKENGEAIIFNIESILKDAELLIGRAGGHKLGNYYQRLANGRTISDNTNFIENKGKKLTELLQKFSAKTFAAVVGVSALIVYLEVMYIHYHPVVFDEWGLMAFLVFATALVILGFVYASIQLTKVFNSRFKGGYERTAILWMIGAVVTTLLTAVYASMLVHELTANGKITWEEIIPKIIVLLAPAFLVRFCIQNYRANSHLSVQYMHRATIMSIAENYSKSTATDATQSGNAELAKISHEAKMAILTEASKVMFTQSESGFITQKEGAGGNGDNMIEILNRSA